jgi:hypothetical protein
MSMLMQLLVFAAAITGFVLLMVFVAVPVFKALGWLIANFFKALGWLIAHVFEYIAGTLGDSIRFIGALIALIVLTPLVFLSVIIGRWSATGHFASSVKREFGVGFACLYRILLRRPLKLFWLHGLLEGVEQRVPEAMAAAPPSDKPSKRTGQFPGYTIVGSLRGGGSGAKLYIAEPDDAVRTRHPSMPYRVVIKSFVLAEGSSLPQIVRESRALECAKELGMVFEHGMDDHRFYYVMPYHAGDHLGIVTRQLHGETDGSGLGQRQLGVAMHYVSDLVDTLSRYHSGGLWHKDVKPENVIVHDGRAHLVDLGLVTHLRSAMTLTTHGTEYFRDPEMVRQALRGVKVHQVNGAKYDIFAAGAVLYFVVENDFPAHGALSRFSKKSPPALQWIIRRAMADYNHRYDTADAMLTDLRFVAAAADPNQVKPADLPSMTGDAEPAHEAYVADQPEPDFAAAAQPQPAAPMFGEQGRRPRLNVVNWWTGEYQVEDPGSAGTHARVTPHQPRQEQEAFRHHAAALRHQASDLKQRVNTGAMSARKAAREQVRAARHRAKAMRHKVRKTRVHRAPAERQPTFWVLGSVVFVLALIVAAAFTVGRGSGGGPLTITIGESHHASSNVDFTADQFVTGEGPAVLILSRGFKPSDPAAAHLFADVVDEYGDDYTVAYHQDLSTGELRDAMERWRVDQNEDDDEILEDSMETWGLYGLVYVQAKYEGDGELVHLDDSLVYSTRDGAKERDLVGFSAAARNDLPYLLINDHPAKHDPDVEQRIDTLIRQYASQGYDIITNEAFDAEVRKVLPTGIVDMSIYDAMPDRLHVVLNHNDLGGVFFIFSPPGEGPAEDRVSLRIIDAKALDLEVGDIEIPRLDDTGAETVSSVGVSVN